MRTAATVSRASRFFASHLATSLAPSSSRVGAPVLRPRGEREEVSHHAHELDSRKRTQAFLGDVLEQLDLRAALLELALRLRIERDGRRFARATRRDADWHRGRHRVVAERDR